ncbi:hypothetical protein KJ695_02430 [Patescibacteria group bacterium]|nr:hypothetical protein [Patescibacteria group bacterium]MBU4056742.1 hypothetical protein [Patescibacteria group bacterium]MBU4368431.1 hypothetical protein [Patescibacteria group bacterium]
MLEKNFLFLKKYAVTIASLITCSILIYSTLFVISQRHHTKPYLYVHDGVIQVEEAIKFLLEGKNPYTENYFETPLKNWGGLAELNGVNPALYHLTYLPFNIIFSIPFFMASNLLLGWFDERFVYIFSFLLVIGAILKWPNKSSWAKLIFTILIVVNPFFQIYFIEGRNDIFVFSWIFLSIYFLNSGKINYSALTLAFAVTSKQTAWFLLPFYFCHLYYNEPVNFNFLEKVKDILKKTKLFFITTAIIIVPFLLWDFRSFIDDIIKYSSGTATNSYPISAESMKFGFQHLILRLGLVKSPFDYWPFWIPQFIFGLPLLYILLKMQKKNNSLGQIIFNYFLLLLTFWSFSRFFNNNYIGVLIILFAFAIFLDLDRKIAIKSK